MRSSSGEYVPRKRGLQIDSAVLDVRSYNYMRLDNYLHKLKERYESFYGGDLTIDLNRSRRSSGIEFNGSVGCYTIHVGMKQAIEDKSFFGSVPDSDVVMVLVSFAHELAHYEQVLACLKDDLPDSMRLAGQFLMPRICKEHYERTYHLNLAENDAEHSAYGVVEAWCAEAFPKISPRFRRIISECAKLEPLNPDMDLFKGIRSFDYDDLCGSLAERARMFDNTPVNGLFRLGSDSAITPGLDDCRSDLWIRVQKRMRLRTEYESCATSLEQERMLLREARNEGLSCLAEFPELKRIVEQGDMSLYGVDPEKEPYDGVQLT